MKELKEVKTIIEQQITRDLVLGIIKIDESAFIRYLVIEEDFTNYNATIILIKASLVIDMPDANDYEEINFKATKKVIRYLKIII